jgi:hypothetical protein
MSRIAVATIAVAVVILGLGPIASGRMASNPPAGLTRSGKVLWNLEALLHDRFGSRDVWVNRPENFPRAAENFTTAGGALCCSGYYSFTFVNARGSAFKTFGPTRLPQPKIGASGGEAPLTIQGSYIYCGANTWLYEHYGNGPWNKQISCHR